MEVLENPFVRSTSPYDRPATPEDSALPPVSHPPPDLYTSFFADEYDNNPQSGYSIQEDTTEGFMEESTGEPVGGSSEVGSDYSDEASMLVSHDQQSSHAVNAAGIKPQQTELVENSMFISQNLDISDGLRSLIGQDSVPVQIAHTGRFSAYSQASNPHAPRQSLVSNVIYYTIDLNYGQFVVQRRYSEFSSLRDALCRLYPTRYVPTIPEKHSFMNYILGGNNTLHSKINLSIIEYRKRYLTDFLVEIIGNPVYRPLKHCELFIKFLDPSESNWDAVIHSPPMTLIPTSYLLANPINPTEAEGIRSLLPLPLVSQINAFKFQDTKAKDGEAYNVKFAQLEQRFHQSHRLVRELGTVSGKLDNLYERLIKNYIELGGNLNNFALTVESSSTTFRESVEAEDEANHNLSLVIEKFGSTIDKNFLHMEAFQYQQQLQLHEHMKISIGSKTQELLKLLNFVKLKQIQLMLTQKKYQGYADSKKQIESRVEQNERLQDALLRGSELSPSIAEAIQRYETSHRRGANGNGWFTVFGGKRASRPVDSGVHGDNSSTHSLVSTNSSEDQTEAHRKIKLLDDEMDSLKRLIQVIQADVNAVSEHVAVTLDEECTLIAQDWLRIMMRNSRNIQIMSEENLSAWQELKDEIGELL
ncbi:hypothetical protein BABINDRAFT_160644 [Babjeviella inositovora NRRL Y-12698]|uniref:PX domain-containing protein n=1 Tax=Babjeviella inositovora NRRL Y-12698 TaxID=984486 RepID=A0A1E3QUA8_9ASCO|nr:uncharacterized protein BABINDRAFT_160644 [Babjeviella inositovora NRRL Y-12698]ODQ81273.1 hypothetical protein BABINDRAFT_160644 [Babjeviella inositovora NRRL Y-12698]